MDTGNAWVVFMSPRHQGTLSIVANVCHSRAQSMAALPKNSRQVQNVQKCWVCVQPGDPTKGEIDVWRWDEMSHAEKDRAALTNHTCYGVPLAHPVIRCFIDDPQLHYKNSLCLSSFLSLDTLSDAVVFVPPVQPEVQEPERTSATQKLCPQGRFWAYSPGH